MLLSASIGTFIFLTTTSLSNAQKSIDWSGYKWFLRDEVDSGPGPNDWSSNNIRIDSNGHLHLKIARSSSGGWTSAELYTSNKFSFGTFRWFVEGAIDKFDEHMVLGLFTYGGQDGTNEIDVEIAKWGYKDGKNLHYTIYPRSPGPVRANASFDMSLQGTYTTHQFIWTAQNVRCQTQGGFQNSQNKNILFSYETPQWASLPIVNAPIHMNLWHYGGQPTREVEVIIHKFQYIPINYKKCVPRIG